MNKVEHRRRRKAYLKRKKEAVKVKVSAIRKGKSKG